MIHINATSLRKNLFVILSNAIKYNEIININTKDGNAVILSEEDFNGLIATLELSSDPKLKEKLLTGKNETPEDCVDVDEVNW